MAVPKDVTEYMVRVFCDRLGTWRFGVVQSQELKRNGSDHVAERC